MDRLTDKIAALPAGAKYFSLEFFPPKTEQGSANLHARLSRMAHSLRPLFVNVTWGAGGSTATKSMALAELTQKSLGLTTCLHLTCTNMSRKVIDETLEQAKELGIRNILALRGDPPRSEEYSDHNTAGEDDSNKDFTWAVDLVRYIRKHYGSHFCVGVAGYPEGHSDQSHPEGQSVEHDLPYLVEKVAAGADFIMTQMFYNVHAYKDYEKLLREHESGVFKAIPIIPGLMPIQSYQIFRRTAKLSHAELPADILQRIEAVKGDDEAVKRVGVDVLSEIVKDLTSTSDVAPRGFHFYTLNLEKVVAQILERCDLISDLGHEQAIADEDSNDFVVVQHVDIPTRPRKPSSTHNRTIIPDEKALGAQSHRPSELEVPAAEVGLPRSSSQSRAENLAISEGEGSLGREATWDDFPNGRWGDARSPAYGEIDGYGISLHVSAPEAKRLWGEPTSVDDISRLFLRHLEGEIDALPWSEEPLQRETLVIRNELGSLIKKGWWTVASQPAINGIRSTDPVFGWGPKNGFVFQKPFVEFFIPSQEWPSMQKKLEPHPQITWFVGDARGTFSSSDVESINPVTWGCFTGKEIITPTIIEAVSFKAWCEEAFGIWAEWQRLYRPGSESSRLLERIRKDYVLVSVIHHGFLEKGALWNDLLG